MDLAFRFIKCSVSFLWCKIWKTKAFVNSIFLLSSSNLIAVSFASLKTEKLFVICVACLLSSRNEIVLRTIFYDEESSSWKGIDCHIASSLNKIIFDVWGTNWRMQINNHISNENLMNEENYHSVLIISIRLSFDSEFDLGWKTFFFKYMCKPYKSRRKKEKGGLVIVQYDTRTLMIRSTAKERSFRL